MDPNKQLEDIRRLARQAATADGEMVDYLVADLGHAVDDLDAWLTRGGALPEAWQGAARGKRGRR